MLFIGSSSIRIWRTAESFPRLPVVNRGFGGAHISDMLFYFDDIIPKRKRPACIVFYCGDNDIADGKSPERVLTDYQKFVARVHRKYPRVPFVFIPIKPSLSRWHLWPQMRRANGLVEEYSAGDPTLFYADVVGPMLGSDGRPRKELFIEDGLHLNADGYALWTRILKPILRKACER